MPLRDFDRIARPLFSESLAPHGFSDTKSKHCIFYRKVSEDIFHFIGPDPHKGRWFDVKVFASSPSIDPLFEKRFPDALGIPLDIYCYLNKWTGVGSEQQAFKCETKQQLTEAYSAEVKPLLIDKGIPALDRIKTIGDLLPLIRHRLFLGFALNAVGKTTEAQQNLEAERSRLSRSLKQDKSGDAALVIAKINELIGPIKDVQPGAQADRPATGGPAA
jgi:hypothetical protein